MKHLVFMLCTAIVIGFLVSATIDLDNLLNYENQTIPSYITKDNTTNNPITNEGATLGRVLFYDTKLSLNNTIACASCHKQEFAFGDTASASVGVAGTTGRHSMRLVNTRFSNEVKFFWDERASSLENQTTRPIQDQIEMGFSATNGDPDIDSLLRKLSSITYYKQLFNFVYGDTIVTETRLQNALAQFIRSIQSFDSKYDAGRSLSTNDNQPFANFTQQENNGKMLFLSPPQFDGAGNRIGGGAGCQGCHQAPEFDIIPNSGNNGVVGSFTGGLDFTNTRSPSLRDIVNANGVANGPFMHTGISSNLITVINHYDSIIVTPNNTTIDPKLLPGGNPQKLHLTSTEKSNLEAFLRTLAGNDIYTNPKWSNPFTNDSIVVSSTTSISLLEDTEQFHVYPNPTTDFVYMDYNNQWNNKNVLVLASNGKLVKNEPINKVLDVSSLPSGIYFIRIDNVTKKIIKK